MKKILLAFLAINMFTTSFAGEFTLFDEKKSAKIFVDKNEADFLKLALSDFISDAKRVGNADLKHCDTPDSDESVFYVGSLSNDAFKNKLSKLGVDFGSLEGKFECYRLQNVGENSFAIIGSDARGTMFGVYEFCERFLGVSPLYYFSDIAPEKKNELKLSDVKIESKEPTVKYRGWFINDEDLLLGFLHNDGKRKTNYKFYDNVINPKLMSRIVEALVRAKFNMIIPSSFLDVANPAEIELLNEATKRGVYVTMHHVEPLGVSAFVFFNYWKEKGENDVTFSYFSSKEKMVEVWSHYAEKWANVPNVIWQIGLRGVGDRPMWFADKTIPDSDKYRGEIISEALEKQVELIKKIDKRENPPITTTLWSEGAMLYKNGFLKIPDGVMVIFADNSPGWKMQADFHQTERKKNTNYGIYYHHQLWSCGPHMAHAIAPSQTMKVLREAIEKDSATYVVMNVSNIREFVVGIETSAKMLADISSVSDDGGLGAFIEKYLPSNADKVEELYKKYYRSFVIHPEREVPFWLDGNLRVEIAAHFRILGRAFKSEKSLKWFVNKENAAPKKNAKKSEQQRLSLEILGDMHPNKGDYNFRLQYLEKQLADIEKVSDEIEKLSYQLPPRERDFIRTNLLSHAYIVRGLTQACKYSVIARKAFAKNELNECLFNLKAARNAMSLTDKGMDINSVGKWKNWYDGDRTMAIKDLEKSMDDTLTQIEEFITNRNSSRKN